MVCPLTTVPNVVSRAFPSALMRATRTLSSLFAPVPNSTRPQQTYLRAALLVADHSAYHLGQLVLVRQALGSWPAV